MELRHVQPFRLAHTVRLTRQHLLGALGALILLRFIAAALLPLSADEAYYWLWSRHLQPGYYDHPPLIALVIRAGTILFGDTSFGVRVGCVFLSVVASWFTYAAARLLFNDGRQALIATLLFNLTLMVAVESMAATPDAPVLAAASVFVYALTKIAKTGDGRWWLIAGMAAGVGLLAKYTMLFLGAGAFVWLLLSSDRRRWLLSPWTYAGGALAFAIFAPNIWWNAQNEWLTFAFQFGRAAAHHFTPGYLVEFVGAQLVLSTPLILIAAMLGLSFVWRARKEDLFLLPALCAPAFAYFIWHGLHDRVQGNWPSFLYPILTLAAIAGFAGLQTGWRGNLSAFCRRWAAPVAAIMLVLIYAQAFFALVPLGRGDPVARLLAYNIQDVTAPLDKIRMQLKAHALLTSDYATTSWLAFYMKDASVIPLGEEQRWRFAPKQRLHSFREPAIYVTETRRDARALVLSQFDTVQEIARLTRSRSGSAITHYTVYRVTGAKQELFLPRP